MTELDEDTIINGQRIGDWNSDDMLEFICKVCGLIVSLEEALERMRPGDVSKIHKEMISLIEE